MAKSESRLLSGRIKTKTGNNLDPRRSTFISLDNAEPNLGLPDSDRYILASLENGTRVFLKLNSGFLVSADSVRGDESTFIIDPSGLANASGTTLAQVLDQFDSAITLAFGSGVFADGNFEGGGIEGNILTLDSDLNIFEISGVGFSFDSGSVKNLVGDSATFSNITRTNTTVEAGTFGSGTQVPIITVDASGFVDSIGVQSLSAVVDSLSYDTTAGTVNLTSLGTAFSAEITLDPFSTDSLSEGSSNLYYTTARVDSDILSKVDSAYLFDRIKDGTIAGNLTLDSGVLSANEIIRRDMLSLGINGAYGNTSTIPVITLDSSGLITNMSTAQIATVLSTEGDLGTTGSIDILDSTMQFTGGEGIDITASGRTITVAGEEASTSNKGVASFSSDDFSVTSGAVTIKTAGVTNTQLAGDIENGKLAFDSSTIGTTSIVLGGSTNTLSGLSSVSTDSATAAKVTVSDLTDNRVVVAGTGGLLEDDANLTYDGTTLTVNNNTASTNVTTGAAVVTGGLGVGGALNVGGNLEIQGNFTVQGTTTTIETQTLAIRDPLIHLADSNETGDEVDIGFVGHYFDAALGGRQHTGIFRDATTSEYYVFAQYQAGDMDSSPRSNNIDISDSSFILGNINAAIFKGTVSADSVTTTNLTASGTVNFSGATVSNGGSVTTVDINGGTIDGATIGGNNAAAGTFSDLTADNLTATKIDVTNMSVDSGHFETLTADSAVFTNVTITEFNVTNMSADSGHFETLTADSALVTDLTATGTIDFAGGTLTLANDQISGDKVEGGTINSITINNLTTTEFNVTNMAVDSGHFETVTADSALVTNIKATGTVDFSEGTVSEMFLADGSKINFGNSNDLEISHNGSNSFIRETGTGSLFIDAGNFFVRTVGGNKYFSGEANIASLYHTNIERLSTTSTGVSVNGGIVADSATITNMTVDSADFDTLTADSAVFGTVAADTITVNGLSVLTAADLTVSASPNFAVDSALFATGLLTNGRGKAIYFDTSTNKWEGATNDSSGEFTATHVIVDLTPLDTRIASTGIHTGLTGLTPNTYYFTSATAGTVTSTPDSAPTAWQPLFYALADSTIDLNVEVPQDTVITAWPVSENPGRETHGGPIIYSGIPSDERLKENIEAIQENALDTVDELNPVSFDFKNPINRYQEGQQLGFIAQQILEVIPQSVYTDSSDSDATLILKPEAITPVLVKAIQELSGKVTELSAKVTSLEKEIGHMKPPVRKRRLG